MHYLRRLADRDLALDRTMIPLGSCTLKLNAAVQSALWLDARLAGIHPYAPRSQTAGWRAILSQLATRLARLTGYDRVSLQPASGAQGELTGLPLFSPPTPSATINKYAFSKSLTDFTLSSLLGLRFPTWESETIFTIQSPHLARFSSVDRRLRKCPLQAPVLWSL